MNLQQKDYYERYWTDGRTGHSGDGQGYAPSLRQWMDQELQTVPPQTTILEVGCGDASFTRDLARRSTAVTAIDISTSQIEENARAYPGIRFLQHDVSHPLPFRENQFDVIWCSEVLEHLFDPGFALQEMHRIMAPEGRLLVTVPYHGLVKNMLIALFKWEEHFSPDNPHLRFFTRKSLCALVAEVGFVHIHTRTCGMNKPIRDLLIATNLLLAARKSSSPGQSRSRGRALGAQNSPAVWPGEDSRATCESAFSRKKAV